MYENEIHQAVLRASSFIKNVNKEISGLRTEMDINLSKLKNDIFKIKEIMAGKSCKHEFESITLDDGAVLDENELKAICAFFEENYDLVGKMYEHKISAYSKLLTNYETSLKNEGFEAVFETAKLMVNNFHL